MAGVATAATLTTFELTMIIVSAVIAAASIAISLYQMLTYKAPEAPIPSPQAISYIPTAEKGKAVPVVFGTRVITQPNVVWWGMPHSVKNQVDMNEMR